MLKDHQKKKDDGSEMDGGLGDQETRGHLSSSAHEVQSTSNVNLHGYGSASMGKTGNEAVTVGQSSAFKGPQTQWESDASNSQIYQFGRKHIVADSPS